MPPSRDVSGYFKLADILGGWFRLGRVFRLVPRGVRDGIYDWVATNRYRLFGKSELCALLTDDQRARLVADDADLRAQLGSDAVAA